MFLLGDLEFDLNALEVIIEKELPFEAYHTEVCDGLNRIMEDYKAITSESEFDTGDLKYYVDALNTCIDDDMDREQIRIAIMETIADVRYEIKRLVER